jgi:hypothetical protein
VSGREKMRFTESRYVVLNERVAGRAMKVMVAMNEGRASMRDGRARKSAMFRTPKKMELSLIRDSFHCAK